LRVEEVKTLPLDGYQAMLNTRPLGGKGVQLFCIVLVPQLNRESKEWYFDSISEEVRDFVAVIQAIVSKANP
jgi:hypothetical protein